MRATIAFAAVLLAGTAACGDGPREDAGEVADNVSGAVGSEDTMRSGPAETMGERNDALAESVQDAKEARADALEATADQRREAADQAADALDNQAQQVRNGQ